MKTIILLMLGAILLAGASAAFQPASAKEANRNNVLAACAHQSDCEILTSNKAGTIGCSDKACFYCGSKTCHQIRSADGPFGPVLPNGGLKVTTLQGLGGSHGMSGNGGGSGAPAKVNVASVHLSTKIN